MSTRFILEELLEAEKALWQPQGNSYRGQRWKQVATCPEKQPLQDFIDSQPNRKLRIIDRHETN
jgi:hypothetical protein